MTIDLGRVLDALPAMVWTALPDGEIDFVSRRWSDYTGLSRDDGHGLSWQAVVSPDDLPGLLERWRSVLASGLPGEIEVRLRRANDGQYRWFLVQVSPLHDDAGRIVKWCGLNADIHERKQSEESVRAIVETTPECVKVIAADGAVLRVNPAGVAMAGAPSAEVVVGQNFFDFVAPEHRARYREFHRDVCRGRKGFLEFDLINLQGSRRHMETHAAPMLGPGGAVVQLGVTRDITERKEAEERLRRSEAFLAEGQHLARMGNLSWNIARGEILWSEPLYRIFGFEPGTVVTLDLIASRVHPDDMPMMMDMVQRARRGEPDFEYQHRIVLPDQTVKRLHLIAHRAGGYPDQTEYIGAVLDITQRRRAEAVLEQLRSELAQVTRTMSLGVLTASIAHEVNQPLAGIITNAGTCTRILAADPPNITLAQETARRILRDGNRAAEVITRLRALFTKRTATVGPVDINDAVREVIALSAGDLQRSRVALRTELADGLPQVGGDRVQLQQVIINLVRNAADAMSGVTGCPRLMLIKTEPDAQRHVRLSVQDAGVGFGPEGAQRLFEAFHTTKPDGMGIGLSVSRSIIESHHGRLWAQENDGGPGATFAFSIPAYDGHDLILDAGAMQAAATGSAPTARLS